MKVRLKDKQPGQSIPLIALMIVVLFGLVGLSVDVGHTYAEQRSVVRSANAAALAGMDALIGGADQDQKVAEAIKQSLNSNGIKVADPTSAENAPDARTVRTLYMDPAGNPLATCNIGQCGAIPQGVSYIQVDVKGTVDTYFARVVGRPTLPVGATAWAARCLPVNSVFPIAVQSGDLDANGFKKPTDPTIPWGNDYSDKYYKNKTWMRVYLKDNGSAPGNFSFLNWTGDPGSGNEGTLQAALTGDGTLSKGFNEAPWADPKTTAPANYPLAPHVLSIGDWIYGNSGLSWSTDVRNALQTLANKRAVVILPIIDNYAGNGNNSAFHLQRLGAFYINGISKQGGANAYIDLVYLGNAKETACLQTNVTPPDNQTQLVRVRGPVSLNPRWLTKTTQQPIAYQIILDVSGSMSMDYYGLATYGGTIRVEQNTTGGQDVWCNDWDNPNAPAYMYNYTIDRGCNAGGSGGVWRKYQERRIYKAKDAIYSLIDAMDPADTMRVVVFTGGNSSLNGSAKAYPTNGWSRDRATLKDAVKNAGTYNNDPYRTQGGTPGADGLQEAAKSLNIAPSTAPDGRTYKPVIIYLTDGMANFFLGGGVNNADDICSDVNPVSARWVTARCQTGKTSSGKLRPIDAMIDQANKIKQSNPNVVLYTVGMSQIDPAGLPQVASSPSNFYPVTNPDGIKSILFQIKGEVTGPCQESGASGSGYIDAIKSANWPSPLPNAGDPTIVGYVELYDQNMNLLPSDIARQPIRHESIGGNDHLAWSLPQGKGLAPGNYIAKAWIYYKGEDGITRVYDTFLDQSTKKYQKTMAFSVSYKGVLGNELVIDRMYLDLDPSKGVCAAP